MVSEMIKIVEFVGRRHGIHQVFADVCHMLVCAFSQQQMEDTFESIRKKYDDKEYAQLQHFLPHLINSYDRLMDPLGALYMEIVSRGKSSMMGQFFTPESICQMLSNITCPPESVRIGTLINDPAVGSGRTLLSIHHSLPNYKKCFPVYVAQDLDKLCVHMTTINMCLNGMMGYIVHGNTLSLETFGGFRIDLKNNIPCVFPMSKEDAKLVAEGPLTKSKEVKKVARQLDLF